MTGFVLSRWRDVGIRMMIATRAAVVRSDSGFGNGKNDGTGHRKWHRW